MSAANTENAPQQLYEALASLCSNTDLKAIRSGLTHGIEGAFRLGLPFEYDDLNHAVNFGDLCLYFSEVGKINLAFVYPGSTSPKRLIVPGINLPYHPFELSEFEQYLDEIGKEFYEDDLSDLVSTISLSGIVFHFDRSGDRRIDITAAFVAADA